jgi:rhamnogalacturonan endolyase
MRFFRTAAFVLAILLPSLLQAAARSDVKITADNSSFTLDNGIVTAIISRDSGDVTSLKYKNLEMLDPDSGRQAAYWSHNAGRGRKQTGITIDPKSNGGARGEVSIKGISGGNQMGSGPGGSVIADIEIRYALGRGDSGLYTYSIFNHPTNYPATSVGEARFCLKLNDDIFDWMTVDSNRNMKMITTYDWNHATQLNMKEVRRMNTGIYKGEVEHKYDYSANQFDVRAWGWSSSDKHVGLWLVNPSVEYLSGGPTKFELSSHRDATFNTNALDAPAPPTLLNYWRGSHYGGSICNVASNESWTKVIGPFLIYCNSGGDHDALWKDALAKAGTESNAWPFDWVQGVDYPHKKERADVTGIIVLDDPAAPDLKMQNLLVGLTAPDYKPAFIPRGPRGGRGGRGGGGGGGFSRAGGGDDEAAMTNQNGFSAGATNEVLDSTNAGSGFDRNFTNGFARGGTNRFRGRFGTNGFPGMPRIVDWQSDARNYEFWVRADARGNFNIPNVRPGTYWLHAIADGVLGDLTVSNIVVVPGKKLALGNVDWRPVRYGRQLWDVGVPNRNVSEFFKGDDYYHWGWYLRYPELFPNDVNFVVGKSDFHKDWFIEQVPHIRGTGDTSYASRGDPTTWTVTYDLPEAVRGKATLRLAICGVGARTLTATVNDQPIGNVSNLVYNATINRDGVGGYWMEHDLAFDASLMKQGKNVLALSIPGGGVTSGIMYDYLRLELDEKSEPPARVASR